MKFKKLETWSSLVALSVGDAAGENQLKILPTDKAGNVAGPAIQYLEKHNVCSV